MRRGGLSGRPGVYSDLHQPVPRKWRRLCAFLRSVKPGADVAMQNPKSRSGATTMSLKTRLTEDMKSAMKSGDKTRLDVIRLINAAIKQREVDERIQLDDAQVLAALEKMLKQRRDSITQFEAAQRMDLADKEKFEVGVIESYMPARLGDDELAALIDGAIAESGATSAKDMGKVVGLVKTKAAGRADMGRVSELIKQKLAALG
jgi:uncharacterized protein